jgi:hypothetical protein
MKRKRGRTGARPAADARDDGGPAGRTRWPSASRASATPARRVGRSDGQSPSCHPAGRARRPRAAAQGSPVRPDGGARSPARGDGRGQTTRPRPASAVGSRRLARPRRADAAAAPEPPGMTTAARARLRNRPPDGAWGSAAAAAGRRRAPAGTPTTRAGTRRRTPTSPAASWAASRRWATGAPSAPASPDHRAPDPAGRDRGLVGAVPARQPGGAALGGGSEVAVDDPLDAPDAPLAITAPPAIGELATVDAPPADPAGSPRPRPETPPPRRRSPAAPRMRPPPTAST